MSTSSSFLCADTAISSAVPPPQVTLVISDNKVPYVSNDIVLVCEIQLPGVVSASDVSISVGWLKGGSEFSGVSGRVTVVTPTSSGSTVQSTVSFSPLQSSDGGRYECEATLTPRQGTSYTSGMASEFFQLTVSGKYVTCHILHAFTVMMPHVKRSN